MSRPGKLPAPNADAFLHQSFNFERHAVGFCLTNKLAVDLENPHFDKVFNRKIRQSLVAGFGDK